VLQKADFHGNPFPGVFCVATDSFVLVPLDTPKPLVRKVEETLEVEAVALTIDGSPILGSLIAANTRGAVVADFATDEDLEILASFVRVERIPDTLNAAGNNILANDHGAIVHPEMGEEAVEVVESVLGVKVRRGRIGGVITVGTAAVATNRGVLCHPRTTAEERRLIEETLGVPSKPGTTNYGSPLVGAGVVANSHGGLVGSLTTGFEMHRIEEALDLIE